MNTIIKAGQRVADIHKLLSSALQDVIMNDACDALEQEYALTVLKEVGTISATYIKAVMAVVEDDLDHQGRLRIVERNHANGVRPRIAPSASRFDDLSPPAST